MSQLIHIKLFASDLGIKFDPPSDSRLDSRTLKSIYNAWNTSAIVDSNGIIWVSTVALHRIIRTDKSTASFHIDNSILEEDKKQSGGKIYVRGNVVSGLSDKILQSAGSIRREKYVGYSEDVYRQIRDSPDACLARSEQYEYLNTCRPLLKKTRIKTLKITKDELTGESCEVVVRDRKGYSFKNMQFSHIRSVAVYPELADRVWNGLITHKGIHEIITDRAINNEEQLVTLCDEYGWTTDWYSDYVTKVSSFRYQ
jgi:hypothetical protein